MRYSFFTLNQHILFPYAYVFLSPCLSLFLNVTCFLSLYPICILSFRCLTIFYLLVGIDLTLTEAFTFAMH
uniref:Uncharacterized protein n=1 Tax=Anguilla anguilla TaxID=7936 RepID=A0A0E9UN49_ANGAN